MVEVALMLPLMVILLFAAIDWGYYTSTREAVTHAARYGARYAATHPTSWSDAASPPAASIEAVVIAAASPATVPNQALAGAGGIEVSYYDPATTPATKCGQFDYASNGFLASGAYTQATCVIVGHLIKVQVQAVYRPVTPILSQLMGSGTVLTDTTWVLEEQ